jgi:hypothetical protein
MKRQEDIEKAWDMNPYIDCVSYFKITWMKFEMLPSEDGWRFTGRTSCGEGWPKLGGWDVPRCSVCLRAFEHLNGVAFCPRPHMPHKEIDLEELVWSNLKN